MRALYDVVLIETVGVGQSETDVAGVADTVLLCVQPGSGDSLQYMKAGIAEIPHIVAVTKADIGAAAERARADVVGALSLTEAVDDWEVPVLLLSAVQGRGIDDLLGALDGHAAHLRENGRLATARKAQAAFWLVEQVRERFGREGVRRAGYLGLEGGDSPFRRLAEVSRRLTP
jgi:LAO/AO transport system kinase